METDLVLVKESLIFEKNNQYEERTGGSSFISKYFKPDGVFVVFPDPKLDYQIRERELSGTPIDVDLEQRENVNKGTIFFIAHEPKDRPMMLEISIVSNLSFSLDRLGWTRDQSHKLRAILMIDAQNLLYSLRYSSNGYSPLQVIEKIASGFQTLGIYFYICSEAALNNRLISNSELLEIESNEKITIVEREQKVINRDTPISIGSPGRSPAILTKKTKVDIDHLLIGGARDWYYQNPDTQCLVLFSGDSDYEDTVKIWAGTDQYKSRGQRKVIIVSTKRNMSKELLLLVQGHDNVELVNLESI